MVYLSAALGGFLRKKALRVLSDDGTDWFDSGAPLGPSCVVGDMLHFDSRRALSAKCHESRLHQLARIHSQVVHAWGGPVQIVSAFCPEPYARSMGRSAQCLHAKAMALDLVPLDGDCDHFHRWLSKRWSGGLVRHPGSIHLDLRNNGRFSAKADLKPTIDWLP